MMIKNADFRIDFIGIGAAKSATTWVADCLRKHPDIFLPFKKELNYFNQFTYKNPPQENPNHDKPLEWYHRYFEGAKPDQVIGEYSPIYMKNKNAAERIYRYNSNIKILTVLRHPVDRAYSSFLFRRQLGDIAEHQFEVVNKKHPYILNESLYYQQLKPYFDLFDKNNINVLLYDDIQSDKKLALEKIYSFLEVPPWFDNSFLSRSNPTKHPRSETVNQLISTAHSLLQQKKLRWLKTVMRMTGVAGTAEWIRDRINVKPMKKKVGLSEETRADLTKYFKKDIEQLENLIGQDLSAWK